MVRDGIGLGTAVGLYGVAFGATATVAGLSVWQASPLSLLMFTGASQFALVGVLATGGSALFLFWNLTTVAGALGAQSFGPVLQAALDSVVPAAFLALLWPRLARGADLRREQRIVAAGGVAIALALTPFLAPGLQIIAAALAVLLAIRPTPANSRSGCARPPGSSSGASA